MSGDPSIEQIEKAIAELGQEYRSPAGWEDRVRAAVQLRRRRRWIPVGALVAAAAAIFAWWWVSRGPEARPRLAFEYRFERSGLRVRGGEAARVGDTLKATVRDGVHRALWLYRGERLVVACPGWNECAASDRVLSLAVRLESPGPHTLVVLRSDARIPDPDGDFDDDLASAGKAGAAVERHALPVE